MMYEKRLVFRQDGKKHCNRMSNVQWLLMQIITSAAVNFSKKCHVFLWPGCCGNPLCMGIPPF